MRSDIPVYGIKSYMDNEILRLTPPGRVWRLKELLDHPLGTLTFFLLIAVVMVGLDQAGVIRALLPEVYTKPAGPVLVSVAFGLILCVLVFGLLMVASHRAQSRGAWERYSLTDYMLVYGRVPFPISERVVAMRAVTPAAEFEIAVLERTSNDAHHGLILFRMLHDLQSSTEVAEQGGIPVMVVSGDGRPVEFERAYMPATSL
jgi:hypothetical protein